MTKSEQLTILGAEKINTLTYRISYREDGVEMEMEINFESTPSVTDWVLDGTQPVLELSGRKPLVSRDFFRGCVQVVLGELAVPVTFSAPESVVGRGESRGVAREP